MYIQTGESMQLAGEKVGTIADMLEKKTGPEVQATFFCFQNPKMHKILL